MTLSVEQFENGRRSGATAFKIIPDDEIKRAVAELGVDEGSALRARAYE
jgi:hypothetical protein